jgi:3-oxoacyl-[acyl-carrier protein] reductase
MRTIAVFGGTGGLGAKLVPFLKDCTESTSEHSAYNVMALGSRDVDVTNLKEVKAFFDQYDIDIVLNMSGKKYDAFLSKITEADLPEIDDLFAVNMMGNVNILAGCLPHMIKKNWGRVIAISSVFAELNVPKNSLYCASKAFVDRLIGTANKENIKYGITCNTIQLGYWDGGMGQRIDVKYQDMAKEKIGLKRWGSIPELYNTVKYIIDNEYVCGTAIRIDGGL